MTSRYGLLQGKRVNEGRPGNGYPCSKEITEKKRCVELSLKSFGKESGGGKQCIRGPLRRAKQKVRTSTIQKAGEKAD